jgi:adenylylsulfate kinase
MKALVLWFTGRSGSGKTTIADIVCHRLKGKGKKVEVLDGDVVRSTIHRSLKFTPEDIKENNKQIARLCEQNLELYDYILVPVISPFRESRHFARKLLSPRFVEVYIKASLSECIKRDVKGLYGKALAGLIENFIGVSPQTPYEEPEHPELTIDTEKEDIPSSVNKILQYTDTMELAK